MMMNERSERLLAEMWRMRFIDAMQYWLISGRIAPASREGGQE